MTDVGVVGKVSRLLRAIAASETEGVGTSNLARSAGINRSTAHRLLAEMRQGGLVDRHEPSGLWLLGPELFLMGLSAGPRYDVTGIAQPIVRRLSTTTAESAFFSVLRGMETVCLVQEEGSYPIRSHVLHEGIRFPLGVASAGLAILSFLPEDAAREYMRGTDLSAFGSEHAHAPMEARVAETRKQGYAVNPGLVVEGSWGMAAAVFDHSERPIGALSLTGVEHRFQTSRRPQLGRILMGAAHELSVLLNDRTGGRNALV
ncbi:IclR family transcriptional regulator [Marmoricola sp. URHB0036]|uniref:IclR family transcriptional regulator n=1 Tax=Marmoricola sp. URHB0036 TaxID=1298863 RepID=UPI0005662988|nr:IclR family transcriptional regulator [Marmoricola sp. URHB0036]